MKFFKNFGIYGLVPIISKTIGFFLIPLYTSYLSVAEYGIQDTFTVFKKLAVFFIVLEVYSGVGRYFYDYDDFKERRSLISSAFNFQILTSILVSAILLIFHKQFYELLIGQEGFKNVYWAVVAWVPFAGAIGFFSVVIRYDNKAREFLYVTIAQLLVRVLLTIYLIVVLDFGVLGIFVGHLTGSILAFIGYFYLLRNYLTIGINQVHLRKILKYSLPLMPGLLILGVEPNITRYLIRTNLSNVEVGYFALAVTVISFYSIIKIALRMTWEPFFFEQVKKSPDNLNQRVMSVFDFFFFSTLAFSLVISIFSKEIVEILAPSEYSYASKIIGLLSLPMALLVATEIAGIGINYVKKTAIKSKISVSSVIIIVLGLWILLPHFDLIVVPIVFLVSAVFRLLLSMFYTKKFMQINFHFLKYILAILLLFGLNLVFITFDISILIKIALVLLVCLTLYTKRSIVLNNIKRINS